MTAGSDISETFEVAIAEHLAGRADAALARCRDLGRRMAAGGRSLAELLEAERAISAPVAKGETKQDAAAWECLEAALTPYQEALAAATARNRRLLRAHEADRRRIADEVHDDPVQVMTAVQLRLAALRRRIGDGEMAEQIESLEESVVGAAARLRTFMQELSSAALRSFGLASAMEATLQRSLGDGTVFDVHDERGSHPGETTDAVLYQIFRDATANIRRHADAAAVHVSIRDEGDGYRMSIEDDGRGFDVDDAARDELGLAMMRERAEGSGGTFDVVSAPGSGTAVSVWLPASAD